MIIKTVDFGEFCDMWRNYGRENSFSYDGKRALYDYLDDVSDETGYPYDLDIVALDCQYREWENIEEFWKDYNKEDYPDIEIIEEVTEVIRIDESRFITGEL